MSLRGRRSAARHRADLDDPTWQAPVLPPREPQPRDRVGIAIAWTGLVLATIGLVANFADWDGHWSFSSTVAILVFFVGAIRRSRTATRAASRPSTPGPGLS